MIYIYCKCVLDILMCDNYLVLELELVLGLNNNKPYANRNASELWELELFHFKTVRYRLLQQRPNERGINYD